MNKEHKYKLQDISNCCYKDMDELIDLYNVKALDYRYRDIRTGLKIKPDEEYNNKAIKVIEEYAVRK